MKIVSVVLPTYNESENIEKSVQDILSQGKNMPGWKIEIVIADSHSSDGTAEIAKKLSKQNKAVHYIDVDRGIGVGLIKGHLYALDKIKPDVLAQMDADGQVDFSLLPRLVQTIEEGYNLVLGSRFVAGGKNELSFSRKLFTSGSSWVCRILMGPSDIKEFTNSARAFTPQIFRKIDLDRLPWREKTFINQPAFLNEAVIAGAKYKEIPLVFKDRAEGYSKNKTINYMYDVLTYAIEARLRKMNLNIPFFKYTHKAITFAKFAVVGVTGTVVDFAVYNLLFGRLGPEARIISAELAVVNNFTWNDLWTFKHRRTDKGLVQRFLIFNLVSVGAILIGYFVVFIMDKWYGDGLTSFEGVKIANHNIYFVVSVPLITAWNFTLNHFVTWKDKKTPSVV